MATQPIEAPVVPDAVIAAGAEGNDNETLQTTPERDFEAEARVQGWRPREEFQGDPAKWTDAETFVRRGEEVLPFIKKENGALKRELSELKKFVKRLQRAEQERAEAERLSLETQIDDATAAGDVETSKRLRGEVEKLSARVHDEAQTHGEDPAEHVLSFRENNPWYDKGALASASELEVEARLFADRTADAWIAQGKPATMPPSQFYTELAEAVNERFPMLRHKPARAKPPSDVAGVTNRGQHKGAKGYDQLPPEAKRQCDRFVANGAVKSREEYVKRYQWD